MIKTAKQLGSILGGLNRITTFEVWEPFLADARDLHIIPAIGVDLYDHLNNKVNDNAPGTEIISVIPEEIQLIKYLRVALTRYADVYNSQRLGMTNSDAGKADPSNNFSSSAPKWKHSSVLDTTLQNADKYLEMALVYLEENATLFPIYINSAFFQNIDKKKLLYNATKFTEYIPGCRNSRTFYLAIVNDIHLEQKRLPGILGLDFYNEVMTEHAKDRAGITITADYAKVIDLMSKFVASRAVVSAIRYINIGEDWRFKTSLDGIEQKNILSDARRSEIAQMENMAADTAKVNLFNFLNDNASPTLFPSYFNSDIYVAPIVDGNKVSKSVIWNDPEKKYVNL